MKRATLLSSTALICLSFGIAFSIYLPALDAPMYYDSAVNISSNQWFFANQGILGVMNLFPQRPIPMVTFYLNYLVGGMAPEYFRIVNVMLLVVASALVMLLIKLILEIVHPPPRSSTEITLIAIFLGLLFLVHPLQLFVTAYIWQRTALMASVFLYASLAMYLSARSGKCRRNAIGYGLCLVFFVCGLLSKENTVILPAVFLVAEIGFFKLGAKRLFARAFVYSVITLLSLYGLSFLEHPHGRSELGQGILATVKAYQSDVGLSLKEVVLTQCRMVFYYLYLIIWPQPSHVQLINPQVISKGLLDPPTSLWAVLGVLALLGWSIRLLSTRPIWAFGILFYLLGLAPEGLLVPAYTFCGYRPALPMFGLWLVSADLLLSLSQLAKADAARRFALAGIVICLIVMSALAGSATYRKAESWRHPIVFWEETVSQFDLQQKNLERFSTSQALNNLGDAHIRFGSPVDAIPYLEKAIEIRKDYWMPYHNLGIVHALSGEIEKAASHFRTALQINPWSQKTKRALEKLSQQMKGSDEDHKAK